MKNLLILILALLLFYLGICLLLFLGQKHLIFFPSREIQLKNLPALPEIEEVYFETADQVQLHGLFLARPSEQVILFLHGNTGNLAYRPAQFKVFQDLHLSALIFDYRSYGKSAGTIKREEDLEQDARAAYRYLTEERGFPPRNLILWGHSLGGALALDLAQEKAVAAVILESPFLSLPALAKQKYPFLPVDLLLRFKFRNDLKIPKVKTKILVMHSPADELIPFAQAQALFALAQEPKTFLTIQGSHNSGLLNFYDLYSPQIREFLAGQKPAP